MSTKSEVTEIEVLTPEQIQELPDTVKDNVVFLTDNMAPKELMVLNPLVSRLLTLKDKASKLSPEKDDKGNIKKEAIDLYKEVKAEQRSFNGNLKKTAKQMKDPINDIRNGIIAIEKTFKSESDKIKEEAEEKFAEYEAEKKRKAEEAKAKKDAEMNAQIEKANQEAEELRLKSEKSEVYNALKYKEILENITNLTNTRIDTYNEEHLKAYRSDLETLSFEKIKSKYNVSILEEDVLTGLENEFKEAVAGAIHKVSGRLNQYQADLQRMQQAAQPIASQEPKREIVMNNASHDIEEWRRVGWTDEMLVQHGHARWLTTGTPGETQEGMAEAFKNPNSIEEDVSDNDFVLDIEREVAEIENELDKRIDEKGISPALADLKQKFLKFNS